METPQQWGNVSVVIPARGRRSFWGEERRGAEDDEPARQVGNSLPCRFAVLRLGDVSRLDRSSRVRPVHGSALLPEEAAGRIPGHRPARGRGGGRLGGGPRETGLPPRPPAVPGRRGRRCVGAELRGGAFPVSPRGGHPAGGEVHGRGCREDIRPGGALGGRPGGHASGIYHKDGRGGRSAAGSGRQGVSPPDVREAAEVRGFRSSSNGGGQTLDGAASDVPYASGGKRRLVSPEAAFLPGIHVSAGSPGTGSVILAPGRDRADRNIEKQDPDAADDPAQQQMTTRNASGRTVRGASPRQKRRSERQKGSGRLRRTY